MTHEERCGKAAATCCRFVVGDSLAGWKGNDLFRGELGELSFVLLRRIFRLQSWSAKVMKSEKCTCSSQARNVMAPTAAAAATSEWPRL